jgi:hypothetical protein
MSNPSALFYDPAIELRQLSRLAAGATALDAVDAVDFPDEQGGDVARELGLPLLPGMDEIRVDRAELQLRAGQKDLDVQFTPSQPPDGNGIFFSLTQAARLRKVDISYTLPTGVSGTIRTVLRGATTQGSGLAVGPPIFCDPPFAAPGPMYAPVLAGMSVDDHGSHKTLTVPSVLGNAWMVQIATGDSIDKLAPAAVMPTSNSITISALPTDLAVTLADEGVKVWSHPGLLLPEVGDQNVSFLPMAQKHLTKALQSSTTASGGVTLSVPLKFHSATGCVVEVSSKRLEGRYVVKPTTSDPLTLQLRGAWEDLALQAPAGLPIQSSSVRITAKLLGRDLNAGSPDPPLREPSIGLRVNQQLSVAVARRFLPLAGDTAGKLLPLVSVRLYVGSMETAEAVLELHNDAATAPGAMAGASIVRQLVKGTFGWVEFELPKPLPVSAGQAPLWVVLRANKGEVLWFTDQPGAIPPRVSSDQGKTWGIADSTLAAVGDPLAQLFHAVENPPAPIVSVRDSTGILTANLMVNPTAKPPRQYVSDGITFPEAMLSRLAFATGQGRVATTFHVFSRSALDLRFEAPQLFYDPFASQGVR